ncbi:MAG: hypothetical protein SGPRY_015016 [Prymnesium sp.]
MLLHHLHKLAEEEHGFPLRDCAIAVPLSYDASQRQAVLDAAEIAGLKCQRLVLDGVAVAVDYAVTRRDLPTQSDRVVAFVDVGQSGIQVYLMKIRKASVELVAHGYELGVGGTVGNHSGQLICSSHMQTAARILRCLHALVLADTLTSPMGGCHLYFVFVKQACEKARRVLSANAEAQVTVDCLVGDTDVSASVTRTDFEALAQPLLERMDQCCREVVSHASLPSVDAVELVGGCSRMPSLIETLHRCFGVKPSRTINAEESVARGAAFVAALHSKTLRMVPLCVSNFCPFSLFLDILSALPHSSGYGTPSKRLFDPVGFGVSRC